MSSLSNCQSIRCETVHYAATAAKEGPIVTGQGFGGAPLPAAGPELRLGVLPPNGILCNWQLQISSLSL